MNGAPRASWRTLRTALYWIVPPLVCLILHWRGLTAWFRADDFVWLGTSRDVHGVRDLLRVLFTPAAQGTIRPWSETGFFLLAYRLFGLHPLPFKIVIFCTQFANLALVVWIGSRLSGRRAAGLWAALLWAVNGSLVEPLGWACTYNQVMCAGFLLLAFSFLLRYIETGQERFYRWQWIAFLAGFGALELNLIYPALAAGYTWLCSRKYFRRTLPLFAASAVYFALHWALAPAPTSGVYALHLGPELVRTLMTYWTWSVGPTYVYTPFPLPGWILGVAIAIVTVGLALFAAVKARRGERAALFCVLWYAAAIAPVLPLRDHLTEYYVFIPLIGLCWLGGWALTASWEAGTAAKVMAVACAALYVSMGLPETIAGAKWNYQVARRVRYVVQGAARAHELYPEKAILLDGVDTDLFRNTFPFRPFLLVGADRVYLSPGSEARIDPLPELGGPSRFVLSADVTRQALARGELVVYDARGARLRNVTEVYAAIPRETRLPARVDAAVALNAYLLGPEWYAVDEDHRWMPRRATLRMAAPERAGQTLHLAGGTSSELLGTGPVIVTVAVNGVALPPARVATPSFDLSFDFPQAVVGQPEMHVAIAVDRTFQTAADPREFGLYFGVIEVR